jgi:hypothetical protein
LLQDWGVPEFALLRGCEEFLIGDAAPQEEREAGCQLQIGDPMGAAHRHILRITLESENELRIS